VAAGTGTLSVLVAVHTVRKVGSVMKHDEKAADKAAQKKPYVRPELAKHGKVESLTQDGTDHKYSSPVILRPIGT
jgi:hypothetical protein